MYTSGDCMGLGMKVGISRARKRTRRNRIRRSRPPEPRVTPEPRVMNGRGSSVSASPRGMVGVVGGDVATERKKMNI